MPPSFCRPEQQPHPALVGHVCPLDGHRPVLSVGFTFGFSGVVFAFLGVPS